MNETDFGTATTQNRILSETGGVSDPTYTYGIGSGFPPITLE